MMALFESLNNFSFKPVFHLPYELFTKVTTREALRVLTIHAYFNCYVLPRCRKLPMTVHLLYAKACTFTTPQKHPLIAHNSSAIDDTTCTSPLLNCNNFIMNYMNTWILCICAITCIHVTMVLYVCMCTHAYT